MDRIIERVITREKIDQALKEMENIAKDKEMKLRQYYSGVKGFDSSIDNAIDWTKLLPSSYYTLKRLLTF